MTLYYPNAQDESVLTTREFTVFEFPILCKLYFGSLYAIGGINRFTINSYRANTTRLTESSKVPLEYPTRTEARIDMTKNGDETDVDCGGELCQACPADKRCQTDSDCRSQVCIESLCAVPNCFDGVQNGIATEID